VHHANLRKFLAALDLAGSMGFNFLEKHFPLSATLPIERATTFD
jgi:hypothetical protein